MQTSMLVIIITEPNCFEHISLPARMERQVSCIPEDLNIGTAL